MAVNVRKTVGTKLWC